MLARAGRFFAIGGFAFVDDRNDWEEEEEEETAARRFRVSIVIDNSQIPKFISSNW